MRSSDFGVILLLSEDKIQKSPKSQWQMFYFEMYLFILFVRPFFLACFRKRNKAANFEGKTWKSQTAHVDELPNDTEPRSIVLVFPKKNSKHCYWKKRDKLTKSIVHKHIIALKCIVLHAVAAWAFGNMCNVRIIG